MPRTKKFERSACPLAVALDIFGDKWTLLIIRDLIYGATRFGDFLASHEGVTTNILAERLKRLENHEIIGKRAYQDNPTRYEYLLTKKGAALGPALLEIRKWSQQHHPGTKPIEGKPNFETID